MIVQLLTLFVLCWLASGLLAFAHAKRRRLPEQQSLIMSLALGMRWLHQVLIWDSVTRLSAAAMQEQPQAAVEQDAVTTQTVEAEPVAADSPAKLPSRPVLGKVKAPCPVCQAKTKHSKDGRCDTCRTVNRLLADKWGLDVADVSADEDAHVLPAEPAARPEIAEDVQPIEMPVVIDEPAFVPAVIVDEPEEHPTEVFDVAAAFAEEDAQIVHAPVFADEDDDTAEETVSEPDFAEPVIEAEPVVTVVEHVPASAPPPASPRPAFHAPAPAPASEMVTLDPAREIEAFDKLPERPRIGTVKTVCPACHERTRHDRDGVCRQCGTPNEWLRKRWDLLEAGTVVHVDEAAIYDLPEPAAPVPAAEPAAVPAGHCPGCRRRARADIFGNCMFCETPIPGEGS